ncbi:hypothetical protein [Frederiksenia canicola]
MNKMYLSIVMLSFVTLSPNTYALCTDFTNSYYYVENDQVSKHTAQAWSCANVNAYSAAYEFENGSTLSMGIRFDPENVKPEKDDEIQGDWFVTLNSSKETINVEIPKGVPISKDGNMQCYKESESSRAIYCLDHLE